MSLPQNKSSQAAQHLKEQILSGVYENSLPSERLLSEQLLVSRNCIRDALAILTQEEVLAPPIQSRRRQILVSKGQVLEPKETRCIIVSPKAEHNSTEQFLAQLSQLRHILSPSNIQVEVRSSPAFRNNSPAALLEELTESLPNSVWVLYQCPENIQKWFESSKLSCLVLGSTFPEISIPRATQPLRVTLQASCCN